MDPRRRPRQDVRHVRNTERHPAVLRGAALGVRPTRGPSRVPQTRRQSNRNPARGGRRRRLPRAVVRARRPGGSPGARPAHRSDAAEGPVAVRARGLVARVGGTRRRSPPALPRGWRQRRRAGPRRDGRRRRQGFVVPAAALRHPRARGARARLGVRLGGGHERRRERRGRRDWYDGYDGCVAAHGDGPRRRGDRAADPRVGSPPRPGYRAAVHAGVPAVRGGSYARARGR
mmetsp:Transcript_11253/g.45423  ORF Transcript_11253/g.45423 Transcript_11253/m.45423 type:complete len:231 (-) Transcript_11253:1038-1730(-)